MAKNAALLGWDTQKNKNDWGTIAKNTVLLDLFDVIFISLNIILI